MINKYLPTAVFFLLLALGLTSCSYREVMNERQIENERLRGAYDAEQQRTQTLKR